MVSTRPGADYVAPGKNYLQLKETSTLIDNWIRKKENIVSRNCLQN
jgi:hypothetical protein